MGVGRSIFCVVFFALQCIQDMACGSGVSMEAKKQSMSLLRMQIRIRIVRSGGTDKDLTRSSNDPDAYWYI